eukprot:8631415-Lingulodinium_polyedra.AAC.1
MFTDVQPTAAEVEQATASHIWMVTEGADTSSAAASATVASSSAAEGSQERGIDPFTRQDPWASYSNSNPWTDP